jgi:hypothetical protein
MKKIYLSFLLAGIASFGNAQTVKLSSNFSNWTNNVPDGWKGVKTNFSTDSIFKVTSGQIYGTAAVQLNNTSNTHKRFTSQPTSVIQGKAYVAKFWVRGKGEIRFGLFDNDLSNGDFGYTYAAFNTINSQSWSVITQQVVADTNYNSAEFIFSIRNTAAGGNHIQIDSVIITENTFTPPAVSIYSIQYTTAANGASNYNGQIVSTGGIVTAFRNFGKGVDRGYYIQSGTGAWSGVWVADSVNSVAKGDSIVIIGKVNEFFSRTQLEAISSFTLVGQTTAPSATVVTITDAKSESYEGVLVKVLDVKATTNPDTYGNYTVTDNSGTTTLNVSNQISAYTADSVVANNKYNITGVVNYSYGAFSLNPRTKFDVESLTGFSSIAIDNVVVSPNPAIDRLSIQLQKTTPAKIEILNSLGQLVGNYEFINNNITINVSELNAGLYFVKITTNSFNEIKPIIIE